MILQMVTEPTGWWLDHNFGLVSFGLVRSIFLAGTLR